MIMGGSCCAFCCSDLFCEWEITTNNPEGQLYVEVTFMKIECGYDPLSIFDGKLNRKLCTKNKNYELNQRKTQEINVADKLDRVKFKGTVTK